MSPRLGTAGRIDAPTPNVNELTSSPNVPHVCLRNCGGIRRVLKTLSMPGLNQRGTARNGSLSGKPATRKEILRSVPRINRASRSALFSLGRMVRLHVQSQDRTGAEVLSARWDRLNFNYRW